ncbi:phosphonate transport system substrate-binding protein [Thiogranum longum]|uniref:Phosphonate transport system substrate-binding protein n=1 Tax=Thiogranum longum TaxID=1537524 RepID=A0A4R1HHE0_9GAMM|nr:phosphate/phosphite/phosphonate ABC transporter substrate-binding protein [Thiogranum longum]TCK18809.1 phosphonate transport system substrate-binding protein [Thiogranum longum]
MHPARPALALLALLCLGWHGMSQANDEVPLLFGVFPFLPPTQLETLFVPVAIDLSRTIRRPVQFRTRPSFAEFDDEVARQTYDLVFMQPFSYARLARQNGYESFVRSATPINAVFVTTEDSPVKTIDDLRGRVLATPPASAAVTLLGLQLLLENHLQPGKDIRLDNRNSHFSCIRRIRIGKAAACVTAKHPLGVFEQKSGIHLRTIAESETIPASTYAIHRRVDPVLRDKLAQRIIGWKDNEEGQKILKDFRHSYYIPSRDSDYDPVRNILDKLNRIMPHETRGERPE